MKFVHEYRDSKQAERYAKAIAKAVHRAWSLMEVCGGQTHSIVKFGIDELLPKMIRLIHGPGCPVCVTPVEFIDKAIHIAQKPNVIFCSFGDMLRVPGTSKDLQRVRAEGADVRIVYSPMDALRFARKHPDKEIVFFAIGFETTAPANAMAVSQAKQENIHNFSMLVSQVLVPPAIEAILKSPDCQVQGFLAAGHVCTIMGLNEYVPIAEKYSVPIVVTGFEPLDILQGIYMCVCQLEEGRAEVENQYERSVKAHGNEVAKKIIQEVFEVIPQKWRGLGMLDKSGLGLSQAYKDFDVEKRFGLSNITVEESSECLSGLILQGIKKPLECPMFGRECTPEHPLGATMVSSEGACAAYFHYRKSA